MRKYLIFNLGVILFLLVSCSGIIKPNSIKVKPLELDDPIVVSIDSRPKGALISFRIESSASGEIPATNFMDIARTPYFSTQSLLQLVPVLTKDNLKDVVIVLKVSLDGYYPIIERLAPKSILTLRNIKKEYELVKVK